jgi:isopropylmalate/homocitrate/citramalate synthase
MPFSDGKFVYTSDDFPEPNEYMFKIAEIECEFPEVTPPTEDSIRLKVVESLRQKKREVQAEACTRVADIEEKIQQLLYIENKGNIQ